MARKFQRCDRRGQKKKAGPLPRQRENGKMGKPESAQKAVSKKKNKKREEEKAKAAAATSTAKSSIQRTKKKEMKRKENRKKEAGHLALAPLSSLFLCFLLGRVGRHFVRLAVFFFF